MIKLFTHIETQLSQQRITQDTPILLLGSCFTDEIGARMQHAGFDVLCNPFGTLYNPMSIASCLQRAITNTPINSNFLVQREGLWHSWLHHSRFSRPNMSDCLECCNDSILKTYLFLQKKPTLIITFGTSYAFYLSNSNTLPSDFVVANCHKLPSQQFNRKRLSIESIVSTWQNLLTLLNSQLSVPVILTVSPIRHLSDGAHANQLSKSTLLLAIDRLIQSNILCTYFDSYELLMDELRDYRFYARDLCHPSDLAVDFIWQRFQDTFMDEPTKNEIMQREKEYLSSLHQPIIYKK